MVLLAVLWVLVLRGQLVAAAFVCPQSFIQLPFSKCKTIPLSCIQAANSEKKFDPGASLSAQKLDKGP